MDISETVWQSWRRHEHAGALVAVSGGGDSLALLELLASLRARLDPPPRLVVAHLDHALREGSAGDARAVAAAAARHELPLRTHRLPDAEAAALRGAGGLQERARLCRRELFEAWAKEEGLELVAWGHTRDDQAETLLLQLLRGASAAGLAGMRERGPGRAWRPLLGVGRAALQSWLAGRDLEPREDPSNRSPAFLRARVRHELLPLMESLRPGATRVLARTARYLGEDERLLGRRAESIREELARALERRGEALDRTGLQAQPLALRVRVLRLSLEGVSDGSWSPDVYELERLLDMVERGRDGARAELRGGLRALVTRGELRLRQGDSPPGLLRGGVELPLPGEGRSCTVALPGPIGASVTLAAGTGTPHGAPPCAGGSGAGPGAREPGPAAAPSMVLFDRAALAPPLRLRSPAAGDRFQPRGLEGRSKRLARYLRDRGVDRDRRERVLLLEDRRRILWVAGHEPAAGVEAGGEGPWLRVSVTVCLPGGDSLSLSGGGPDGSDPADGTGP